MDDRLDIATTEESDNVSGLSGFLQSLAGYYSQFLETDFKASREPKRRFTERDKTIRVGIQLSTYPTLKHLIVEKLEQTTPASFSIKYGKYTARLSPTIQTGINSAIKSVNTDELVHDLIDIEKQCVAASERDSLDFEIFFDDLELDIRAMVETSVVSKVLAIIKPVLKNNTAAAALEEIETFTDEIVSILINDQMSTFVEAVSETVYEKSTDTLTKTLSTLSDRSRIQTALTTYFNDFAAKDAFVELREIISTHQVTENSQVYLNVGKIISGCSKFPMYYIPVSVEVDGDSIRLEFSSLIYANKKAVDFVLSKLKKEHQLQGTNPIIERIFHKAEDETYLNVVMQTFHSVLAALNVEGDVDLLSSAVTKAHAHGITVTNELTFSLFDKSDESIVNDYEALMVGLEEGNPLLDSFREIVESFLTENPVSIEIETDKEWDATETSDRVVFQSPLPLAEEQRKVLSAIRNDKSKFIIVEGPPGTGKSHTITAIAFELILSGRNVLVLSDKKEALDVVEGKLNDVITKVRGTDTVFVNPILRLGKADSNFSKITKKDSIDKLKTSVRTFRENENNFNKQFTELETGLKSRVKATINSTAKITFEEINGFHNAERELLESLENLESIDEKDNQQVLLLAKAYGLLVSDRARYAEIGKNDRTLSEYLRLLPVLREVPQPLFKLAKAYPELKLDAATSLNKLCSSIVELRRPIIGYLFSGRMLMDYGRRVEEVTCVFNPKPHQNLEELRSLAHLPNTLSSVIDSFGGSSDLDMQTTYDFLRVGTPLDEASAKVVRNFSETQWSAGVKSLFPVTVKELLGANDRAVSLLKNFEDLMTRKELLKEKFDQIPDFDYLQEKTQLESMNTLKLVNRIDERVTDFAINKKADAKTLQQIIRSKAKFPVDKFDVLREAFPCMIAGLRDFAEFIPLERDLFDLVVIDEASQVSIAQALPAILRAKKVLVLGDRRQFGNVKTANASKQINTGYFKQVMDVFESEVGEDISQRTRAKNFNIKSSVMDFFEYNANFSIQLKKHFRGYPEMISFSSKYMYDGGLQALKIRGKPLSDVLEFVETPEPDRLEVTRNANAGEANVIIERLHTMLEMDEPPSVAIITPHREQVTSIQKRLSDDSKREELFKRLKLAVFTFDTCQGEERDVIFYSMVGTRQQDSLNYIFPKDIELSEDEVDGSLKFQRLNVGFSRGKEKLVFVLSKPIEEYRGAIKRVLLHYSQVLESATNMPKAEDTDQSSPMEARVLEWIKATSFVNTHAGTIEIIPQFELGAYLKALNPSYAHPAYKVDFLVRLQTADSVQQCIIEYDGFEYHFDNRDSVEAANWRSYLTDGDVEREFVLESFGYKMLRINRFNVGKDPITTLDQRLSELFGELDAKDASHKVVKHIQAQSTENIKGLKEGTHKKCSKCDKIKPKKMFADSKLKSGYGKHCKSCKKRSTNRTMHHRRML
ncbi:AAA domain-containing protein [Amphritea sp.]|uniref:AAA domain-containing protein n=1 Tax=Amphritea sp. TaxID=1872502 RepID=UPI0025C6C289|nr:AAA domain-containing protein [Amphritea sp.]